MATDTDARLIKPISERHFELHALSLDRGPNFERGPKPPLLLAATLDLSLDSGASPASS